ncbi:19416_t:CDS:1, partial [Racocetra fulgida]
DHLNEFEIASYHSGLSKDDIIVNWQDLNNAKGDLNPVEGVKFYDKYLTRIFGLKSQMISRLFPEQPEEKI